MDNMVLEVNNLEAGYETQQGTVRAVNKVTFNLRQGEFLGIAGESGCGKSTLAYAIMQLLEDNGKIFAGEINFLGNNIVNISREEIKTPRWENMSMVFQSAMNALNPVLTISEQLVDAITAHRKGISHSRARKRALELLELVDIQTDRIDAYPHQLSGGMKQRVMIAMALILNPELVILDEPTTALDVVVQRNIIEKIEELQQEFNFSVIFITHDLSLLVEISDRLAIMYAGRLIETGPASELYTDPLHPYTRGLMNSFPPLTGELREFGGIPGKPPDLLHPPQGCSYYPRCPQARDICASHHPHLENIEEERFVSCFLYTGGENK